jgi:hypothetical protein
VFPVPTSAAMTPTNTSVTIVSYTDGPGPWDSTVSTFWDNFAWDFTPVEGSNQILLTSTVDYNVVGNTIVFANPVSADPLSTPLIPLTNIIVRIIVEDWRTTNIVHDAGQTIFNGNPSQIIPGGYNPLYNQATGNTMGMQWKEHMQGKFLLNKPGNINKP